MGINLGELLSHRASLSDGKECFVDSSGHHSFSQANERCERLAAFLAERGVSDGDRIAVYCKNSEFLAAAVFAAAKLGAVAVVLNWRLQLSELEYILSDCRPKAMLYDADFGETVDKLRLSVPLTTFVSNRRREDEHSYEEIVRSNAPKFRVQTHRRGHDPAIIMYTSGTTGKPKGAVLSHDSLFWAAQAASCTIKWNMDHRFLLVAPMFHIGGLMPLIANVLKGCATIFLSDFSPDSAWQIIARERITSMMSVPAMLQAMLAAAQKTNVDSASLVNITCGASAVPKELIDAYLNLGIKVQQVYGITEFGGALTFWTHEMGMDNARSQGKVLLHGEVKIVDASTLSEVSRGTAGEIWCRGPMIFSGYWNNPEASRAALHDGWYRSGDVGYIDEEGFVFVIDRIKDMIISGGENIYPAEIERVLSAASGVAEVAVVGQPDARWGEIPVAYVVRKAGSEVTKEELIATCKEHLASYKCIKEVCFVDALPRNSVGKVLKRQLRINP